jgi:hypothetical protein
MHYRVEITKVDDSEAPSVLSVSLSHFVDTPESTPVVVDYCHLQIAQNARHQLRADNLTDKNIAEVRVRCMPMLDIAPVRRRLTFY